MRRWSKLQQQLYNVISPDLDLQVHCRVYRMSSQRGSTDLPRYWITLGQEVIWDYPRQFPQRNTGYPYITDVSDISALIREYVDTPPARLLAARFEHDKWGLTDILKAADRRIGRRQLEASNRVTNEAARRVLQARLKTKEKSQGAPADADHASNPSFSDAPG